MLTHHVSGALTVGLIATGIGLADPVITKQPMDVSASLGATIRFSVTVSGTPPFAYQWLHQDTPIAWATNRTLTLTNIERTHAGPYILAITDVTGTTNSNPAFLDVDSTFTKITTGALATDKATWRPAAWGDYNNDGYPDVYLHQRNTGKDLLYRNNGDGTFTKLTEPTLQRTAHAGAWGSAWGDFDNDGLLDLFIANNGAKNVLLRHRGDGTFEKLTTGPAADGSLSSTAMWGDYDRDGCLDLLVANGGMAFASAANWLYHNQGDGTFSKIGKDQMGTMVSEAAGWILAGWIDWDDNGWLDLFLPLGSKSRLYANQGEGQFTITTTAFPCDTAAWADYDNDGRLDLFGASMVENVTNVLYRNEGAGAFQPRTAAQVGAIVTDKGVAGGVAWGDFDNDGYQDLFVARGWWYRSGTGRQMNLVYHNRGDGTFARVTTGSPANELSQGLTANWVDYDRDGFLDLFVTQYGQDAPSANCLYRNNGNQNNWLAVNCIGTSSPRFGTGAKVRAKATIRGKTMWQLRLIDAGGTAWGGQSFTAHFGLGDATVVDTLRLEWPSGLVQELDNVPARQFLTVTEPSKMEVTRAGGLQVHCWKNQCFQIETSPNLRQWHPLATLTNLSGRLLHHENLTSLVGARFYRARSQ